MVQDHSKANAELQQLARQEGVELPTKLDKKHRKTKERLSELSGEEFDQAYMKNQLEDHKHEIKLFERQVDDGQDKDVRAWAEKTLPTLRNHKERAQEVASAVGVEGKGRKAADAPER